MLYSKEMLIGGLLISIPLYVLIRFLYIKKEKVSLNWYHEIGLALLVIYFVELLVMTVVPKAYEDFGNVDLSKVNLVPFKTILGKDLKLHSWNNIRNFVANLLGNIFLFTPISLMIGILNKDVKWQKAILIVFTMSLAIELFQLVNSYRISDIDDVILNTLGGVIGWLLFRLTYRIWPEFVNKFIEKSV